jgi:hypothetical protein
MGRVVLVKGFGTPVFMLSYLPTYVKQTADGVLDAIGSSVGRLHVEQPDRTRGG